MKAYVNMPISTIIKVNSITVKRFERFENDKFLDSICRQFVSDCFETGNYIFGTFVFHYLRLFKE